MRAVQAGAEVRTTASTAMNDYSSRSHSVFTIIFTQVEILPPGEHRLPDTKQSYVNLVDLAGSERVALNEANPFTVKEGAAINLSLHTLGLVISALADGKAGTHVPYRDSSLTFMLKESLGGNAKTVMLATISPCTLWYEETMSTLRYAERTKKIVNTARINEDPNIKLMRALQLQINQLRAQDDSEDRRLLKQMQERERLMSAQLAAWQDKMAQVTKKNALDSKNVRVSRQEPHLMNLAYDTGGTLLYYLHQAITVVGSNSGCDLVLPGLAPNHCRVELIEMENSEGKAFSVVADPGAGTDVYINGNLIQSATELKHNDRLFFGTSHKFLLKLPGMPEQHRLMEELLQDAEAEWLLAQGHLMSVDQHRKQLTAQEQAAHSRYLEAKHQWDREAQLRHKEQQMQTLELQQKYISSQQTLAFQRRQQDRLELELQSFQQEKRAYAQQRSRQEDQRRQQMQVLKQLMLEDRQMRFQRRKAARKSAIVQWCALQWRRATRLSVVGRLVSWAHAMVEPVILASKYCSIPLAFQVTVDTPAPSAAPELEACVLEANQALLPPAPGVHVLVMDLSADTAVAKILLTNLCQWSAAVVEAFNKWVTAIQQRGCDGLRSPGQGQGSPSEDAKPPAELVDLLHGRFHGQALPPQPVDAARLDMGFGVCALQDLLPGAFTRQAFTVSLKVPIVHWSGNISAVATLEISLVLSAAQLQSLNAVPDGGGLSIMNAKQESACVRNNAQNHSFVLIVTLSTIALAACSESSCVPDHLSALDGDMPLTFNLSVLGNCTQFCAQLSQDTASPLFSQGFAVDPLVNVCRTLDADVCSVDTNFYSVLEKLRGATISIHVCGTPVQAMHVDNHPVQQNTCIPPLSMIQSTPPPAPVKQYTDWNASVNLAVSVQILEPHTSGQLRPVPVKHPFSGEGAGQPLGTFRVRSGIQKTLLVKLSQNCSLSGHAAVYTMRSVGFVDIRNQVSPASTTVVPDQYLQEDKGLGSPHESTCTATMLPATNAWFQGVLACAVDFPAIPLLNQVSGKGDRTYATVVLEIVLAPTGSVILLPLDLMLKVYSRNRSMKGIERLFKSDQAKIRLKQDPSAHEQVTAFVHISMQRVVQEMSLLQATSLHPLMCPVMTSSEMQSAAGGQSPRKMLHAALVQSAQAVTQHLQNCYTYWMTRQRKILSNLSFHRGVWTAEVASQKAAEDGVLTLLESMQQKLLEMHNSDDQLQRKLEQCARDRCKMHEMHFDYKSKVAVQMQAEVAARLQSYESAQADARQMLLCEEDAHWRVVYCFGWLFVVECFRRETIEASWNTASWDIVRLGLCGAESACRVAICNAEHARFQSRQIKEFERRERRHRLVVVALEIFELQKLRKIVQKNRKLMHSGVSGTELTYKLPPGDDCRSTGQAILPHLNADMLAPVQVEAVSNRIFSEKIAYTIPDPFQSLPTLPDAWPHFGHPVTYHPLPISEMPGPAIHPPHSPQDPECTLSPAQLQDLSVLVQDSIETRTHMEKCMVGVRSALEQLAAHRRGDPAIHSVTEGNLQPIAVLSGDHWQDAAVHQQDDLWNLLSHLENYTKRCPRETCPALESSFGFPKTVPLQSVVAGYASVHVQRVSITTDVCIEGFCQVNSDSSPVFRVSNNIEPAYQPPQHGAMHGQHWCRVTKQYLCIRKQHGSSATSIVRHPTTDLMSIPPLVWCSEGDALVSLMEANIVHVSNTICVFTGDRKYVITPPATEFPNWSKYLPPKS